MKCMNCGNDACSLYELAESINCGECWETYWRDEDIGMDTSFEDFLNHTCSLVEKAKVLGADKTGKDSRGKK